LENFGLIVGILFDLNKILVAMQKDIIFSEQLDFDSNFEQSDDFMEKIAQNLFQRLKRKGLEGLGYIGGQDWISGVSGISGVKGKGAESYLDAVISQFNRELKFITDRLYEMFKKTERNNEKEIYAKLIRNILHNKNKAIDFAKERVIHKESSSFNEFLKTAQIWKWKKPIDDVLRQQEESSLYPLRGRQDKLDRLRKLQESSAEHIRMSPDQQKRLLDLSELSPDYKKTFQEHGQVRRRYVEQSEKKRLLELNEKIKEWQRDVLKPIFERFFKSVNKVMQARGQHDIRVGDPTRKRS